jgi:hypothetical protein
MNRHVVGALLGGAAVAIAGSAQAAKNVTYGSWTLTPGGTTYGTEGDCINAVSSSTAGTWHCTKDDTVVVTAPAPGPTVSITANPTSVAAGSTSTLNWSSTNATTCSASGGWSGTKGTSGSASTGPVNANTTYSLTCTGTGGSANGSATVMATTGSGGTQYGLDWPGNGSVRRMLYWSNPFPIYDATYIFKVYPRKKTVTSGSTGYYTTFFWGNNGDFSWNGGPNTYYGAHPYPIPAPNGPGQWEISAYAGDYVTGQEVSWNRWYTQAFRAWRTGSCSTRHEFYWDLPDTSKVLVASNNDCNWAKTNPPRPAIVMGQAPNVGGYSWGGYPGWEEFNGVIRGIQIYSGLLSVPDILNEIAQPQSTATGASSIWYLNLNPRPGDVADKKGTGTPHNPVWDGSTANQWSQ